ncbi:MAG TPA: hypothetical protein VFA83_14200 [Acidimicrobiales bacterium]|nr:hypothetical protein [Acidimicrobiales bacterium]
MYATGWHNGSRPEEPSGYGLKFVERDRHKHFDREWSEVVITLEDGPDVTIALSPSFFRSSSELRSAELGRWFLESQVAPWRQGSPPGVVVSHIDGNRFSARILKRKGLATRP